MDIMHTAARGAALMAVVGCAGVAEAQVELPPLVSDRMVIQRDAEVPLHGRATGGTMVRVDFDGVTRSARADTEGRWRVRLPPRPAGGPHEIVISADADTVRVRDVLVGDVWIASGQSNMEWPVADALNAEAEVAAADDAGIRNFRVPRSWSYTPARRLVGGEWQISDSEHVGAHSAVAYFFARELREHVDVPIGIIDNSWGGARLEPYMNAEALGLGAGAAAQIEGLEAAREQRLLWGLRERIGTLPTEDAGMVDGRPVWADPALDDSEWSTIAVPARWEQEAYPGLDGVAWYRRSFELSADEAAGPVHVGVGMIDDGDITWVNGVQVGGMEMAWNRARRYGVPADVLREGRNVLTVRVVDTGGGGGIHGPEELLYLETVAGRRPLAGEWRFRVGEVSVGLSGEKNQVPTLLWNQMIRPLVDFPIRGVIWYQGESNAYPGDAEEYRDQFRAMIRSWRAAWGQPELPFLWVQLANFMEPGDGTEPSDWAMLRESQTAALSLPHTAQALAIDVGQADDIHPRDKQTVGERLARGARAVAYGQDVVYSGPVYRSHRVTPAGRVELTFDHVDGGLVARGDAGLEGFVVAGRDGRFLPAEARIEGDRVVVWSDRVPDPVAVRYAWADNPEGANLYNREGLPTTPFRTDRVLGTPVR